MSSTRAPPGFERERVLTRHGLALEQAPLDTSRWRIPNASAKRQAIRLRKQGNERSRPVSRATEVIRTWSIPQGTIHSKGVRSLSTFTARPCVDTPPETRTPIEAIFASPAQMPVCGCSRRSDSMPSSRQGGDDRPPPWSHEVSDAVHRHHRVGHELAGTVVGHAAAAIGLAHVDAALGVPGVAHRQVARLRAAAPSCTRTGARAPAAGPGLTGPPALAELVLKGHPVPVAHRSKLGNPEFGHATEGYSASVNREERFGRPGSAGACAAPGCGRRSS